ncbi:hypothetical protein [Bdellovibrio sp. BCCA]|uniref:hypothetical protein n=1 Tax=Bdellovibrio sp. BCCA TaxID=3136281 RepID=UPI0030F107B0
MSKIILALTLLAGFILSSKAAPAQTFDISSKRDIFVLKSYPNVIETKNISHSVIAADKLDLLELEKNLSQKLKQLNKNQLQQGGVDSGGGTLLLIC